MTRSTRVQRFLTDRRVAVRAPSELVPAPHFFGTDPAAHRFSFYGETFDLGGDINWDANPGTPHWGHDLNRFGFLVLFDPESPETQTRAMIAIILDWIRKYDRSRYTYSPYAWQNLLNVAIRIENWLRFLDALQMSGSAWLTDSEWERIRESIAKQLFILLTLIKKRGYESNWTFLGLRSAAYVLFASPSFPHRDRLLNIVWHCLEKAVERQILPDGAQQELSPHYHWVVLEILHSIQEMSRQAGFHERRWLTSTIEAMARFLDALILPDDGIISFGDSDFDYGPRILAFLKRLPNRGASPSETEEPDLRIFHYAGIAVSRDRQNRHVLAFDAGPHGTGHQHEDCLSFWLTAFGENFVVDPGRYLYDSAPESMYAFLRSTAAHSTIMIDGRGQGRISKPDTWRRAAPGWPYVEAVGNAVNLKGRYCDGYGAGLSEIVHERTIECNTEAAIWTIHDIILGEGEHFIEARFQLGPYSWNKDGQLVTARSDRVAFRLDADPQWGELAVIEGSLNPKGGWFSSGLNRLTAAPCVRLSGTYMLPFKVTTKLSATKHPEEASSPTSRSPAG